MTVIRKALRRFGLMFTHAESPYNSDSTLYYDKEWAMFRTVKGEDHKPATYCASPVILNKKVRKSYLKQLKEENKLLEEADIISEAKDILNDPKSYIKS